MNLRTSNLQLAPFEDLTKIETLRQDYLTRKDNIFQMNTVHRESEGPKESH